MPLQEHEASSSAGQADGSDLDYLYPRAWPRPGEPGEPVEPGEPAPVHAEPTPDGRGWLLWVSKYDPRSVRTVIGDDLRIPAVWCQLGSCISRFTDTAALGESDVRSRAVAAGWREDALGRLTCPNCVQRDPMFWIRRPLVPWLPPVAAPIAGSMAHEQVAETAIDEAPANWIDDDQPPQVSLAMAAGDDGPRQARFRRRDTGRHRRRF